MRRLPSLLAAVLLAASFTAAAARPAPPDQFRFEYVRPTPRSGTAGVHQAASAGTTYFGGTFWAADSGRWEAIQDSAWTFDTGVGSHFDHSDPHVDSFKDTSLHAYMEGWIGVDATYSEAGYFRRLTESDFTGPDICVGDAAGLGGDWSFWCGVLPEEADALCYLGGQGYGESWNLCIERSFPYTSGNVTVEFDYVNETEGGFDFTHVLVDTGNGGDPIALAEYTGAVSGTENLVLIQGTTLPSGAGTFTLRFCVLSDGSYSDQDGLAPSACGAFALDNVSVTGTGINHVSGFETGEDGWGLGAQPPGPGGEWSRLADLGTLAQPLTSCECALADSVLLFEDLNISGHNAFQDNFAASPWIDLLAAGLAGSPGKVIAYDTYTFNPLLNYIFTTHKAQWYPDTCPVTGKIRTSPFTTRGFVSFFGEEPFCTSGGRQVLEEYSTTVAAGAEQMRIGIGVISFCRFFAECNGLSNSTPWFDNVRLGVFGTPGTPLMTVNSLDVPQDAFPANGVITSDSAGRLDAANVKGGLEPEPGTSLGDTLVVEVDSTVPDTEVRVQFAVRPGPGIDSVELTSWLTGHAFEETRYGLDWYSARMDTAEQGGALQPGHWMTTYHEDDPNFSGTDSDPDFADANYFGGFTHLANDIFPDNLFTPGTRVMLFYKARVGAGQWGTYPDTSNTGRENVPWKLPAGSTSQLGTAVGQAPYLEWECLPSSMVEMTTGQEAWNCLLYVDRASGSGAQPWIEEALAAVLPYPSLNFENTAWDRMDVEGSRSNRSPTFGRPSSTNYGATVTQALGYRAILWDASDLALPNLFDPDATVFQFYLAVNSLGLPGNRFLYMAGDNLAASVAFDNQAAAHELLNDLMGVTFECSTFHEADCPAGTVEDPTTCVALDPVIGAPASSRPLGGNPVAEGNGCPLQRRFDVLQATSTQFGSAYEEETYDDAVKGLSAVASVSFDGTLASRQYRTLFDGVSLAHRRDIACDPGEPGAVVAIEERLREAFSWWAEPYTVCREVGRVSTPEPPTSTLRTRLGAAAPNPLSAGKPSHIAFTLAAEGPARIEVFDVRGARVATLVDAKLPAGEHETVWRGTDDAGRPVASGVYFYRLSADRETYSRKLIVVRGR